MSEPTQLTGPQEQRDEALLLLVVATLLFSTLDGIFTLLLIRIGDSNALRPEKARYDGASWKGKRGRAGRGMGERWSPWQAGEEGRRLDGRTRLPNA